MMYIRSLGGSLLGRLTLLPHSKQQHQPPRHHRLVQRDLTCALLGAAPCVICMPELLPRPVSPAPTLVVVMPGGTEVVKIVRPARQAHFPLLVSRSLFFSLGFEQNVWSELWCILQPGTGLSQLARHAKPAAATPSRPIHAQPDPPSIPRPAGCMRPLCGRWHLC